MAVAVAKQSWVQNIRVAGGEALVPVAVVGMVFVMLVPLPGFALDLLLSLSITASVVVLLTALQLLKPVEFSVFPSLILLLTLFRLSLDLASSRRILLHGSEGPGAAGAVIESFGKFVVGGNYVVGFVLFIALIAIQFLVISHGAVRTAEVTARFTLDAMPGKQMAIDADMNAGLINDVQARARRAAIAHEAEFYGAMDGAARFSQRDSMATILITAINIVAGFLIGVLQQGVPFMEALKTYTVLTVGHGLVTMIPSLLVSVAGGIVLTRSSSEDTLGKDLGKQLFSNPKPLWIAAGVLLALALIPGLPKLAFLLISSALALLARQIKSTPQKAADAAAAQSGAKAAAPGQPAAGSDQLDVTKLDDLMLEVGLGLVPMVDTKQGGQLLGKIRSLRKNLAQQLGFLVPSIHITDNVALKEQEYVVYLRGVEIARWELRRDCLLAICSEATPPPLAGIETKDPAFNVNAKWITQALQAQALSSGYAVVDRTSVLATHLSELIKQNAHDLLSRQETKRLIDRINESHPKLVEELIPKLMTLGEVQRVLQQLLREQVSIRDLGTILEVLVDSAATNKNPVLLVEAARHALARGIVKGLLDERGGLKVFTLNAALEEECSRAAIQQIPVASTGNLQVSVARRVLDALKTNLGEQGLSTPPILMCSSPGRFYLRRMLEPFLPKVVVISPTEVPAIIPVQAVGCVR
jgi:flagellar biosynthesis protein FlhA